MKLSDVVEVLLCADIKIPDKDLIAVVELVLDHAQSKHTVTKIKKLVDEVHGYEFPKTRSGL